jgi:hypothetical protein
VTFSKTYSSQDRTYISAPCFENVALLVVKRQLAAAPSEEILLVMIDVVLTRNAKHGALIYVLS